MKDRSPLKLTGILVPYNLAMAGLNFYIAFQVSPELRTIISFHSYQVLKSDSAYFLGNSIISIPFST